MRIRKNLKFPLSLCALSVISTFVQSQESAGENSSTSPKLETIEVTAQRRTQNIQDVPISVQALTGEQLDKVAVDKIDDLQLYIPNLSIFETGISTQLFVRGVGSGNNQGFEQSVVQFVDGISYARQQLSRAPFFDMERAEVLRGPQSILFGKNAIGGALNFTTAEVEEYNTGEFFVQAGQYGIREYQGIVNGELYDGKLFGRLSVRHYEDDGYMRNDLLDRDEAQREDQTIRAKLLYIINDDWKINFKYENNQFDAIGRSIEIIQDIGNPGNAFGTTLGAGFGLTEAIVETNLDYTRTGNGDDSFNESDNFLVEVKGRIGSLDFESRTGFLEYELNENCDCDFIGANILNAPLNESYDQMSQEFRIATDLSNKLSWQAGLFYLSSELSLTDSINVPEGQIGRPDLSVLPTAVFALTGSEAQGQSLSGTGITRNFMQDTDSISIFAQVTYKFTDNTQVSLGGRWSDEEKDGFRDINITDTSTGLPTQSPVAPLVYAGLFGVQSQQTSGHSLTGSRSETAFDPSINIQHYLDDDIMLYANWSKGSKAGGFDARANLVSSFEFEDEEATSIELGIKSVFWDRRAKVNLAVYSTDYDNLQVSQFDGTLGFVVGNANVEMRGVEVDGSIALHENLTLNYAAAYLDHEFVDYPNGNCYYRQQFDTNNPNLASRFNEQTGLCDYTGLTGQYAPEFTSNINLDYFYDILENAVLHVNLNYNYTSSQNTHQNLDPDFEQDSIGRVDLNIALEFDQWGIEILGRNITNEEFITYSGNTPLSGTFGADTIYGFVAPPSIWTLRAYYEF